MTNKKYKIAFIHPDLGIGGAERLILDIAAALKKENHDVVFLTNHFDENHAFDDLKDNAYEILVYGDWLPRSICGKFQALCAYVRMVYLSLVYILFVRSKHQPDVYITDLIPIAVPFFKLANEKIIYYCHHPDLLASPPGGTLKKVYRTPINWLELKATAMADVILVNSEYTATIFRDTFPEITKAIEILYPTIATSYERTVQTLGNRKHISELVPEIKSNIKDPVIFLSVNRFHPAKKLSFAIEAMDKLKHICSQSEWDRCYFIMAGGYDPQSRINLQYYEELVKLAHEKNLQNKIVFLKSPSDKLKAELLNSCTCLVYTPVKEHFGIVPLEAMLVSKPVIAVNSGGPRETVENGKTGYLCQPNGDSMGEFLYKIVNEDHEKLGKNGRKRLDEKFSTNIFEKAVKQMINKTVAIGSKKHT